MGKTSRERSPQKRTRKGKGEVKELRQSLYSWDDGGGGEVPGLPDFRS